MEPIRMVYRGGEGEITEKKSRFIATIRPVKSEEEALAFIAEMKKKYWNARHNCHAFVIGERQELQRCSDDGEPQGTAGRPMLDVLLGEGLHDTAVVVTRYFGGILLGTGGLVRAYSQAVKEGLVHCTVIEKKDGLRVAIQTDYSNIGKIQYLLGQRGLPQTDAEYADTVTLWTVAEPEQAKELCEAITNATGGRARFPEKQPVSFAAAEGKVLILDA